MEGFFCINGDTSKLDVKHGDVCDVIVNDKDIGNYRSVGIFNVYEGGDEVAFLHPETKKEMRVTHFKPKSKV